MASSSHTSNQDQFYFSCVICWDKLDVHYFLHFHADKCDHDVCEECIVLYLNNLLSSSQNTIRRGKNPYERIACPFDGCQETFETNDIVKRAFKNEEETVVWWRTVLLRTRFAHKIFCPFEDCEAVLDADPCLSKSCCFVVCFECLRGFCSSCQTKWHPGEVRSFDDAEAMKKDLKQAELSNFCRCPACGDMIEKIGGCLHIECECGTNFCYRCGHVMYDDEEEGFYCSINCHRFTDEQLACYRKPMFDYSKSNN